MFWQNSEEFSRESREPKSFERGGLAEGRAILLVLRSRISVQAFVCGGVVEAWVTTLAEINLDERITAGLVIIAFVRRGEGDSWETGGTGLMILWELDWMETRIGLAESFFEGCEEW